MLKTCARCEHLQPQRLTRNICVVGCARTGLIVPHAYDSNVDPDRITLWRVPKSCPRPAAEVAVQAKPIPQAEWEVVDLGPFQETTK